MSYILDALNKSEQERARKRAPGLAALHGDQGRTSFRLKHFLIILLVLIGVNLVGLFAIFGDRLTPADEQPTVSAVEPEPEPEKTDLPPESESALLISPAPSVAQPLAVSDYDAVPLQELPSQLRARLPAIEITAHIYASDAELRMVKIDGVSRHEGDVLGVDFRLLEITETGVVLEFEGQAYILDIVEDWAL